MNETNTAAQPLRQDAEQRIRELVHEYGDLAKVSKHFAAVLRICWREASAQATEAAAKMTQAARDVLAERERQKSVEGWTEGHDDEHTGGELARAAAVYAAGSGLFRIEGALPTQVWPWRWDYNPKDQRRNLIRAGALIVAEIERLDRIGEAAPETKGSPHG